jgi:hypothetical protein
MRYYVRLPGSPKLFGPYSLGEIQRQVDAGELTTYHEAHLAEGQSYGTLMHSRAWQPLRDIYPDGNVPPAENVETVRSAVNLPKPTYGSPVTLGLRVCAWLYLCGSVITALRVWDDVRDLGPPGDWANSTCLGIMFRGAVILFVLLALASITDDVRAIRERDHSV